MVYAIKLLLYLITFLGLAALPFFALFVLVDIFSVIPLKLARLFTRNPILIVIGIILFDISLIGFTISFMEGNY